MATVNSPVEWYLDVLPVATVKALNYLSGQNWLKDSRWYLAGGTALALQVGHRQSVDLDFFIKQKKFLLEELLNNFSAADWQTQVARADTIYGRLLGAKVSFIAYTFFTPQEKFHHYGAVRVLDKKDIAVMKLIAISQRGKKRDFFDLYWYAKNCEPLEAVLMRLPDQYLTVTHNYYHLIKSLAYFADAEADPMPRLFFKATWPEVKIFFMAEVRRLSKTMLGLK